jgi:hypothetical protein
VGAGIGRKDSRGGLSGRWEIDGPGEERLPEDDAGNASVPQSADARQIRNATGDEHLDIVRPNERSQQTRVRLAPAVGQHDPPNACGRQLGHELRQGRHGRPPPGKRRQAFRPRVEADGQPISRDLDALTDEIGPIGRGHAKQHPRGPGREGQSHVICLLQAAGELDRDGDPRGNGPYRLEVHRRAGARAVEVDDMDEPGAQLDESLGDPLRAVRGGTHARAGPRPEDDARTAPLDIYGRDDEHAPSDPGGGQQAAMEADGQGAMAK